jgi:tRNA-dihydrouridine synthase 3
MDNEAQADPKPKEETNPTQPNLPGDLAVTRAEKAERHGLINSSEVNGFEQSPSKRLKMEEKETTASAPRERQKGVAHIKAE